MRTDILRSDDLSLFLELTDGQERSNLIIESASRTSFGLALFKLIRSGPEMTLGTNVVIGEGGCGQVPMFGSLSNGLYVAVTAPPPLTNHLTFPTFVPPPQGKAFWIGPCAPEDLDAAVQAALAEQRAFENWEVRQVGYTGFARQVLHVLLDGCLLDYPQLFEGGRLAPLPLRLSAGSVIEIVNALLPQGIALLTQILLTIAMEGIILLLWSPLSMLRRRTIKQQ